MPVLPLIDLLILIAWTSLIAAGLLKAVGVAMAYPYGVFGMHPLDFVYVAAVSLLFALALAARVWVRAHEPTLQRVKGDDPFGPGRTAGPREGAEREGAGDAAPRDRAAAG